MSIDEVTRKKFEKLKLKYGGKAGTRKRRYDEKTLHEIRRLASTLSEVCNNRDGGNYLIRLAIDELIARAPKASLHNLCSEDYDG